MLLKALELSKSELGSSTGYDKIASSSQKTPSTWEDQQDEELREALRQNIYETHISQEGQAGTFITSTEGVMYSEKDMAIVRQVLINFKSGS